MRASRRQNSGDYNLDYDFNWDLSEEPMPSPSPPPTPPASWGGTPYPQTPPPRDVVFEPTKYEAQVEADDYDKHVSRIRVAVCDHVCWCVAVWLRTYSPVFISFVFWSCVLARTK